VPVRGERLEQRVLGPGQSAAGEVGFVVPESAPGLRLRFDAELDDASASVPLTRTFTTHERHLQRSPSRAR
jgi:hypothetical protein